MNLYVDLCKMVTEINTAYVSYVFFMKELQCLVHIALSHCHKLFWYDCVGLAIYIANIVTLEHASDDTNYNCKWN